jgi:hypothetical protein
LPSRANAISGGARPYLSHIANLLLERLDLGVEFVDRAIQHIHLAGFLLEFSSELLHAW